MRESIEVLSFFANIGDDISDSTESEREAAAKAKDSDPLDWPEPSVAIRVKWCHEVAMGMAYLAANKVDFQNGHFKIILL